MSAARCLLPLALLILCGARWPAIGGRVTIYVAESEEGRAIHTALRERLAESRLVHPAGTRAAIRVETAGEPRARWNVHPAPDRALPMTIVAEALEISAGSAGESIWAGLDSCTFGEDLATQGITLHFREPTCDPTLRFAFWNLPPGLARPAFSEVRERPGLFRRGQEPPHFPPLLDEIALMTVPSPPIPGAAEITISPAAGARPARTERICVAYRIQLDPATVSEEGARWLRRLLNRASFTPLLADAERCETFPVSIRDRSSPPPELLPPSDLSGRTVQLTGISGARGRLISGRIRALLARHDLTLTLGVAGADVPDAIRAELSAAVVFLSDPLRRLQLADDTSYRWTVLTTGQVVSYGDEVMGTLTIPEELWLATRYSEAGSR